MSENETTNYGSMFQSQEEVDATAVSAVVEDSVPTEGSVTIVEDEPLATVDATITNEPSALFVMVKLDRNTDKLRLRSAPSTDSDILDTIPNGEVMMVIDLVDEDWTFVEYAHVPHAVIRGYVLSRFVVESDGSTPSND